MKKFNFLIILCLGSFIHLMAYSPPPKINSTADKEFHDLKVQTIEFADYVFEMQIVKTFTVATTGNEIADAISVQSLIVKTSFALNSSGAAMHYSLAKSRCFQILNIYSINPANENCIEIDPGWNKLLSC